MSWVHLPLVSALGWALLHFVWEGALIALLLSVFLAVSTSTKARYGAACAALFAMAAAFAVTAAVSMPDRPARVLAGANIVLTANAASGAGPSRPDLWALAAQALPWVVPYWMAGVLAIGIFRMAGWIAAERMRRAGVCAASGEWQRKLAGLAERAGVTQTVRLVESSLAEVPVVIGVLRPVILIPVGLLAGLPAAQMEAILLHELAHVHRLDYLVNVLQSFVESALFYHPAVWWVSRVMRAERENCCDDVAIAVAGDRRAYTEALVRLEELRSSGREPALAATGGQLMNRIRRLLNRPEEPRGAAGLILPAALLTSMLCLFAAAMPQQAAAQEGKDLAPSYRKWVNEEVVYIIRPEERTAFLALKTDPERDQFITQFWARRGEAFKKEHYRRIQYANERFHTAAPPGWKTDRGRIYIVYGPPDEIEAHPSDGREQWLYRRIEGIGDKVIIDFVDSNHSGVYRQTSAPHR